MGMPDDYTDECNDCGSYNNTTIISLCKECREEIIDKWASKQVTLPSILTYDIKELKKLFALE